LLYPTAATPELNIAFNEGQMIVAEGYPEKSDYIQKSGA